MKVIIHPLGERVLVEPFDLEGATAAGVIIPLSKGSHKLGKIVAVGDDLEPLCEETEAESELDDDEELDPVSSWGPPPVAVGDSIIYNRFLPLILPTDDSKIEKHMVALEDIQGRVEIEK